MSVPYFVNGCSSAVMIIKNLSYYGGQAAQAAVNVAADASAKALVVGKQAINSAANSAVNAVESAVNNTKNQLASAVSDVNESVSLAANIAKEKALIAAVNACVLAEQVLQQNPRKFYAVATMAAVGAVLSTVAIAKYSSGGYFDEAADSDGLIEKLSTSVVNAAWQATKYISAANTGAIAGGIFGQRVIVAVEKREQERAAAEFRRLCTTKKAF